MTVAVNSVYIHIVKQLIKVHSNPQGGSWCKRAKNSTLDVEWVKDETKVTIDKSDERVKKIVIDKGRDSEFGNFCVDFSKPERQAGQTMPPKLV